MAYDAHMNLLLREVAEDYTVRLRTERTRIVGRATAVGQVSGSDESAEAGAVLLPQCILPWQETGLCAVLLEEHPCCSVLSLRTPLMMPGRASCGMSAWQLAWKNFFPHSAWPTDAKKLQDTEKKPRA